MREKGRGTRERREGYCPGERQRTALDREEMGVTLGKRQFIKVQAKPCVRMRCLSLIGRIN